jgi:dihydrolipoamide dehydrogenase
MEKKIIIIGGGPAGYVCAIRAAQLGAQTMVVEKGALGGTCLNWGCVPTKTLLHAARIYRTLLEARKFGIYCTPGPLRFDRMVEKKNVVVQNNVSGIENLLKKHHVTVIRGAGQLLDSRTVEIRTKDGGVRRETGDALVIASGSKPLVPGFMKLDKDRIITTTEALDFDHLPESIAIVGGSVSGCEFASLFGQLGSKVTLIEMLDRIVPTEDIEISRRLEGALRVLGIEVMTKTAIRSVEKRYPKGSVKLTTENKGEIHADYCLLAMGRTLNTADIGLEQTGIEFSAQGIMVNERMETNKKNVYAIGDVTGKILLAHVASEQGIVAAENIMGMDSTMDYAAVPSFIYTDPEIGSVGLKEQEAKEKGVGVLKGKVTFKANAMAHAIGNTTGFVKTLVEAETKRILGIHILGPHATDLLGEAVNLVAKGMTLDDVRDVIHPHPTLSETIKEAVLASIDMAIHG